MTDLKQTMLHPNCHKTDFSMLGLLTCAEGLLLGLELSTTLPWTNISLKSYIYHLPQKVGPMPAGSKKIWKYGIIIANISSCIRWISLLVIFNISRMMVMIIEVCLRWFVRSQLLWQERTGRVTQVPPHWQGATLARMVPHCKHSAHAQCAHAWCQPTSQCTHCKFTAHCHND